MLFLVLNSKTRKLPLKYELDSVKVAHFIMNLLDSGKEAVFSIIRSQV